MQTSYIPSHQQEYTRGFILVLLAAFSYGLQPFFAYFAYQAGADPIGLLFARFSLAAILLLLWLKKRKISLPTPKLFAQTLLIGIGYAGAALGYYSASHSASVSLAVILMFSFPAFVTLYSILFLAEKSSWSKIFSLVLASSGVLLATGMDFHGDMAGIFWALFAALSYGSAILYGTHKVPPQNPMASAGVILVGGAVTFSVALMLQGADWPQSASGWFAILGLALFATILPIATFISGSPRIGASDAATLSTLEPIVAVAIAVILIEESLSLTMLTGGTMVIIAAVILSKGKRPVKR
ncbi:DMT family transporter [Motiliproteus sp. MSK22-1]|uniref:DMT family transporter n=1 Tax=Motiliproteus sp. MSK22-1 TaxID=1897630 RepID=UPI0009782718|nr:DMT family transporter [Motiliproteus sp. MSK22-1]OMH36261.1 multidrug DMT transporter [Motiliproteus sp. MSK22-1]